MKVNGSRYDFRFDKDQINAPQEIIKIAEAVTDFYLTDEQAEPFRGDSNGKLLRELQRTRNNLISDIYSQDRRSDFKKAVDNYNSAIDRLVQNGALATNLDNKHGIPHSMVELILDQVYARTVSPDVESLRDYVNGSNEVYGELLAPLVKRILHETQLSSDKVFVDLGSGVGNVVLQAALQVGCESWGCEIAENACKLARAQKKEFAARCQLWGIAAGKVHLREGDFRENKPIQDAMKRADVILVNNEVFSSDLNQTLIELFLDCKDGCKIVSLKSFVPPGHQITTRNRDNPINVLEAKEFRFYESDVSWTGGGGRYYIATKDSERVARFLKGR